MKLKKSYSKRILTVGCIILVGVMLVGCTSKAEQREAIRQEKQLEEKKKQRIKDNANDQQAVLENRESDNEDVHKPSIIIRDAEQKQDSQTVTIPEDKEENDDKGIISMTPPKNSQDVIDIEVKDSKDVIVLEKDNEDKINIEKDYDSSVIIKENN